MKIVTLYVLRLPEETVSKEDKEVEILREVDEVYKDYGILQRKAVQESLQFSARTIALRTAENDRQMVELKLYKMHVYKPNSGQRIVCAIATDLEYPNLEAQKMLTNLASTIFEISESKKIAVEKVDKNAKDEMDERIKLIFDESQDPKKVQSLMSKVQNDLDETKIILHKTIEKVLERGEKLDDLVAKSNALSFQTKTFYKTAKKQNSCCVVM